MKVAIVCCISLIVFALSANGQQTACVNRQVQFEQLTITPSFVSIFGNIPITIQGPSLQNAVSVQIRFNDKTLRIVNAVITGSNTVKCILPFLYKNGRIQVDMLVKLADNTIRTFHGFIYIEKHRSSIEFEFVGTTSIKVSWDRSHFDVGAFLDLELLEVVGGIFKSRGILKSLIPNDGFFSGELDILALTIIQQLKNIFIVQLNVNVGPPQNPNIPGVTNPQQPIIPNPTKPQQPNIPNPTKPPQPNNPDVNRPQNPLISNFLDQLRGKSERELNDLCNSWYIQDKGAPTDALCCPPTLKKAQTDERFEPVDNLKWYNPDADFGFQQKVPSRSGAVQRCVYKNGVLLVGLPSGGNVRSVSPNSEQGEMSHIIADILPWLTCCKLSVTKSYCDLYYERRPSNDGKCYDDPHSGIIVGDPHFTTFDGFYYTFLGLGEFWIIQSRDFSMQGRFTRYLNTGATVCTVYVLNQHSCDGDATIQLSLKPNYIEVMIDGQVVAIDPNVNNPKRSILYNGVSIAIFSPKDIRISFSSGYSFKFTYDPYVINLAASVSEKLKGTFRGLFGVFDGNQRNELTYPSGKIIPTSSDSKAINDFGMHWKITCEESLFTYPFNKSHASFHDESFVPSLDAPDLDKLPPKDVEACKGSYECLFDLSVTGNVQMATSTLGAVEEFVANSKSSTRCDRISAPRNGYIEVTNYSEGSTVQLVCKVGFKVQGLESVKCVKDLLGALSWDGKLGSCGKANICANENAWLQFLCENNQVIQNSLKTGRS